MVGEGATVAGEISDRNETAFKNTFAKEHKMSTTLTAEFNDNYVTQLNASQYIYGIYRAICTA